jgi:5-methylcytosine-specific restriction endonuclease McrA
MDTKTCNRCNKTLSVDNFYAHPWRKGDLNGICKACLSAQKKEHYQANKALYRERNVRNYWRDPEASRAASRANGQAHQEAATERARQWTAAHPDAKAVYQRRYRAAHPNAVWNDNHRKRGAIIRDLTAGQWRDIRAYFLDCCAYCGRQVTDLTQDHLVPLIQGGQHTAENIVPACRSCNSRKGAKSLLAFLAS